jgi:hypothetical protein
VPEAEEGGADTELQYVEVSEATEDQPTNCADEGKPGALTQMFSNFYATIYE